MPSNTYCNSSVGKKKNSLAKQTNWFVIRQQINGLIVIEIKSSNFSSVIKFKKPDFSFMLYIADKLVDIGIALLLFYLLG